MNNDNEIAGDPLGLPELRTTAPQHPATVAQFAGLARALAEDRDSWAPLVRYDPISRWYHRLRTGPGYEVWLLSWVPGQNSGRHDHGVSSGVFTVLEGTLTEQASVTRVLSPGVTRVFAPGYVHEVVNTTLTPAVSLHIYFPGLTEMPMRPTRPALAAQTRTPQLPRPSARSVGAC